MSDIFRDYSFGGWLREFRIKRKLTLRAASKLMKMDVGNYSKLETSRLPPPKTIRRLLKIVEPLDLYTSEIEMLKIAAFNYHLGKLRKGWDVP